jgi:hypothetical protein
MNRFLALLLVVLAGLTYPVATDATVGLLQLAAPPTYFVNSATGSDSNPGTLASPFATIQKCANVSAPGVTCFIRTGSGYGGGTGQGLVLNITISGSGPIAGSTQCLRPITFAPYPGDTVTISGTQGQYAIGSTTAGLQCIVISGNLILAGWNGSLTWAGASANAGAGNATTNGVYNGYGIKFAGTTGTANIIHHITIGSGVVVHDFPGAGIGCNYCDYLNFAGTGYNNSLYSPLGTSGFSIYEPHNIDAGTGYKIFVRQFIAYSNQNLIPNYNQIALTTTSAGLNSSGTTFLTVASSTGANYTQAAIHVTGGCIPPGDTVAFFGSGFIGLNLPTTCNINNGDTLQFGYITDGNGVIIDNNTNSQSDSIAYVGRTLVGPGITYYNGYCGVSFASGSNNVDVWQTTNFQNQQSVFLGAGNTAAEGEICDKNTNGSTIYNNISSSISTVPSGWDQSTGTTTWSNNAFFGGNGSQTLPGSNNVTTDPKLTSPPSNMQLQAGSPAIGAGNAATLTLVPTNFAGSTYSNPPNIGAY